MKKILIVEDVELNIELLTQLLEDEYELISAKNGEQGVAVAAEEQPDLILMDMSLPVLNGWEATRRLKADDTLKHIPVIALTAHAMSGDEAKAQAAGCDDYLTKPFNEDLLFEKVKRFLKE
ncbi:MAG TPA: response regulator [Anaerolineae bacterium]|nr:response regulator [Anaerolineae bacterium]